MATIEPPTAPAPRVQPTMTRVVVTDFDMPFWSIVILLVKWAIAAIPAAIILIFIATISIVALGGTGATLRSLAGRAVAMREANIKPLVVTARKAGDRIQLSTDASVDWQGCSLIWEGRGGSIPNLRAGQSSSVPLSLIGVLGGPLPETGMVLHCLRPSDQDARIYVVP